MYCPHCKRQRAEVRAWDAIWCSICGGEVDSEIEYPRDYFLEAEEELDFSYEEDKER